MDIKKLYGIMPALMTAFDGDKIDSARVGELVKKLGSDGVHGFYVGGSSGEMVLCSTEERKALLETVMENKGDLAVIAHVGCLSTKDTVELSKHAKACGADAVSSVTPLYYKYSFAEVKNYYRRIAEASELPVIIYNIPGLTGTAYGYDQLCELLEIEGVQGMKFTSSDFYLLNRLVNTYPEKVFYNGSDEMLLSGLAAGAHGGIGTTYNFMPDLMVKIYSLAQEGKFDEAREVQSVANKAISAVLRNGVLPSCKHLVSLYGVPYGECREPFMPLDDKAKEDLCENAWKLVEDFRRNA
ncbi:MAG: N-acetylneuraminate lyase [Clostridia bacterium]|nr:N-acetylneuraminate lyase [Clostridia bacterium]